MNDGLFFVIGLVLLFVLWVSTGGPTRPISFAGPYITPITNEGQKQSGYGPQVSFNPSIGGTSISIGAKNGGSTTGIANTSLYTGQVFLNHQVNGLGGSNLDQEYIGLQVSSSASAPVDISGWKLISTVSGASATIPEGVSMLKLGTVSLAPIMLSAGNTADIATGPSPVNVSFELNSCANYLTNPANYSQCYAAQSSNSEFLTGQWRIYLNESVHLWKNSGEIIELEDSSGKVVDSFSY